jgi:hypothetical protein
LLNGMADHNLTRVDLSRDFAKPTFCVIGLFRFGSIVPNFCPSSRTLLAKSLAAASAGLR